MQRKTVGIIGGMGPHSTIRLFELIVERTPVTRESDHLRILIDNRPQIPDRTAAILGKGPSPVPALQESAQLLQRWGAELIAIACNTAHYFWKEIQNSVHIPVLNMIERVAHALQQTADGRYLLLATTGTVQSGLYQQYIPAQQLIVPDALLQERVMAVIYGPGGVKQQGPTTSAQQQLLEIIQQLAPQNPAAIIAGCTEIELLLPNQLDAVPVVKPLEVLATAVVQMALNNADSETS